MSDYIRVSTQMIDRDRNAIQDKLEEITVAVDELLGGMQALGSTWEGPAWQGFQNQVASDVERMKEICDQLGVYLQHIGFAGQEYQKCEHTVEDLVRNIRI